MATPTAQYNHSGSKDDAYAQTATQKRAERYTVTPAYTLSTPNGSQYGCCFVRLTPEEDRPVCDGLFVTDPPTPFQGYQWSQAAYERARQEAGFRRCAWYPSAVAPEDLAPYGEAYWQDWREPCLVIGLVCRKNRSGLLRGPPHRLSVVSAVLCRARQRLSPYGPGVPYPMGLVGSAKEHGAALGNACGWAEYGKAPYLSGRMARL